MIFSMAKGSDGSGEERYVAYVPFNFAPGATLKQFEGSRLAHRGDPSLFIEKLAQETYALCGGPFLDKETAASHIDVLRASLLWLSLKQQVGLSYGGSGGTVTLYGDSPQTVNSDLSETFGWTEVDGHYDHDSALVRPEHLRLVRYQMGRVGVRYDLRGESVLEVASEAIQQPSVGAVVAQERLKVAIEIFAAHRYDLSDRAQFTSLVTVLEALTPNVPVSEVAAGLATRTFEFLKSLHGELPQDSEEREELNRLLSRVANWKHATIGESLAQFVHTVVERHDHLGDSATIAARMKAVYRERSRLLHAGQTSDEFGSHHRFLRSFVPKLLQELFLEAANGREPDLDFGDIS